MSNYKYYLKDIAKYNNDVVVIELADATGKPVFNYKPGQYVMIAYVNEAGKLEQRHAFSIASSPSESDHLALGIKIGGPFTQGLLKLKIGAPISVAGPYGNFIFNPKKHTDLVLLAGGIGITPLLSAMTYATDNNLANKLSLLYSVRTFEGANFLNDIKQLESRNPNLRTLLSVTDKQVTTGSSDVINGRVNSQILQEFVGDIRGKTFFICGPTAFMESVKNDLLLLGVYKSRIEMEAFSMLDDKGLWPQFRNLSYAIGFSAAAVALIFYSIVNASALTKSIKSVGNSLNPVGTSNLVNPDSASQNSNAPAPVTSVSGVPTTVSPFSSNVNSNGQQINRSVTPSTNNNWSTTPQPTTSTSIPVQSQRQVTTLSVKNSNVNSKNTTVVPNPVTASSTPINQSVINTGGSINQGAVNTGGDRNDDDEEEEFDD